MHIKFLFEKKYFLFFADLLWFDRVCPLKDLLVASRVFRSYPKFSIFLLVDPLRSGHASNFGRQNDSPRGGAL